MRDIDLVVSVAHAGGVDPEASHSTVEMRTAIAEAIGMLNILPVHSQSGGRIFLLFADDAPKTVEIMSKIILLAEDKKIKDLSILQQLR